MFADGTDVSMGQLFIYLFLNRNISHRTNKQTDICHIELTAIFILNRIFTVITFLAGMKLSCRMFWTIVTILRMQRIPMPTAATSSPSGATARRTGCSTTTLTSSPTFRRCNLTQSTSREQSAQKMSLVFLSCKGGSARAPWLTVSNKMVFIRS